MTSRKSKVMLQIKKKVIKFYSLIDKFHWDDRNKSLEDFLFYGDWKQKPNKKLKKILSLCGLKFLGAGASRFTVQYENYAIKLDKLKYCGFAYSYGSHNDSELWAYNELKTSPICKYLIVPMIGTIRIKKNLALVYPLVEMFDHVKSTCKNKKRLKILNSKYNTLKLNLMDYIFTDYKTDNIGIYKNELFYLDFDVEDGCNSPENLELAYRKLLNKMITEFETTYSQDIIQTGKYIKEMKTVL